MAGDDELHATGLNIFDDYGTEDSPNELYGGSGDDSLRGNDGNDTLRGEEGVDEADGDDGIDDCDAEVMVNCP
jgi:Ca2+-binding RTX toxin-like protein